MVILEILAKAIVAYEVATGERPWSITIREDHFLELVWATMPEYIGFSVDLIGPLYFMGMPVKIGRLGDGEPEFSINDMEHR